MVPTLAQFTAQHRRLLVACVLALNVAGVASLTGCASDLPIPVQPLAPATANPPTAPVPLLRNMSVYQWPDSFDRLEVDIERAMNKQEWALLNQEKADGVIRAEGVVPDNRHAWITAWRVNEKDIAVAVRVGLYGDEPLESLYAARLKQVLAGKAKPKRNWGFELPPLPKLPPFLPSKDDK